MFLPRVIRNKGFREPDKVPKKPPSEEALDARPAKRLRTEEDEPDTEPSVPEKTTATIDKPQQSPITSPAVGSQDTVDPQENVKPRGPRFAVAQITDEYLEKLVCGMELIFSDYAHLDLENSQWLQSHYRTVKGEEQYIHLSAFLTHNNITTLKPAATQPLLARALTSFPSEYLQTNSAYDTITHVRRNPKSFPLPFIPSTARGTDTSLASPVSPFWTQRTIYVEPHQRSLCNIPAAVAWYIKTQGGMRKKWLPVQAVNPIPQGRGACAFIVLSGVVEMQDMWDKWIKEQKPKDWIAMTRAEHSRREAEYVELQAKEYKERRGPVVFGRGEEPAGEGGGERMVSKEAVKDEEKDEIMETVAGAKKRSRKRQKKKKKGEKTDTAGVAEDED